MTPETAQKAREGASGQWLSPAEAQSLEAEWADLAARAIEPNPFYSPALLIPAIESFAKDGVRIAVMRDGAGRLIGLLPVAPLRGYSRLPVRYLASWMYEHCFFAAPLLRNGEEARALSALFDLVEGEGAFFRLRHLSADGPIATAARRTCWETGRRAASSGRFERAMLAGGYKTQSALEAALRGKKRKELRRQRARLEEQGALKFEALRDARDVEPWTEVFLALEIAGWKGGAATALASTPEGAAFFRAAVRRAFEAGMLDFFRLAVAERPVAMIVNFTERGGSYSFKIAYDEECSRFSPGVQLEIEMMRTFEAREGLKFVDSCAAADHPMINSLWRERRAIEAVNISGRSAAAKALFSVLTGLERLGDRWRDAKSGASDDDL